MSLDSLYECGASPRCPPDLTAVCFLSQQTEILEEQAMSFPWRGTYVCCQGVRPGSQVRDRAEHRVQSLPTQGAEGEVVVSFAATPCSTVFTGKEPTG